MPMPIDERKRGSIVAMIRKKIKGSDYDSMKCDNEEQLMHKKMEDGAEVENAQSGLDAAAEEIISAIESKNPSSLVPAIRSLVVMIMNEYDD